MALRCFFVSALLTPLLFCFVAVQAMLDQNYITLTKEEGKTVIIGCRNTGNCYTYLHWYQKKDDSAMQRILYMNLDGKSKPIAENGFEKFEAELVGGTYRLRITELKPTHAATYYCACWGGAKQFGSGTKLIVSDKKPVTPDVTVYHNPKNKEILCVARNMFPDVLKMTWQKEGVKEDALTTIQEMKGTVSSLIIMNRNGTEELTKYACQVEHEGFQKPQEYQVVSTKGTDPVKKSELLTASLSYCLLILKSLTYFGIMSVLIYKRSSQTS